MLLNKTFSYHFLSRVNLLRKAWIVYKGFKWNPAKVASLSYEEAARLDLMFSLYYGAFPVTRPVVPMTGWRLTDDGVATWTGDLSVINRWQKYEVL
jgi:hypothetical protein